MLRIIALLLASVVLVACPNPSSTQTVAVTGVTIVPGTPSAGTLSTGLWTLAYQGSPNETLQFSATVTPSNASNTGITWSLDVSTNVSITAGGLLTVTGVATGSNGETSDEFTVTATAKDGSGKTATFTVNTNPLLG